MASNKVGNRSKGSGFSDFSIHAERNVIKELGNMSLLRGADMFVFRIPHACHGLGGAIGNGRTSGPLPITSPPIMINHATTSAANTSIPAARRASSSGSGAGTSGGGSGTGNLVMSLTSSNGNSDITPPLGNLNTQGNTSNNNNNSNNNTNNSNESTTTNAKSKNPGSNVHQTVGGVLGATGVGAPTAGILGTSTANSIYANQIRGRRGYTTAAGGAGATMTTTTSSSSTGEPSTLGSGSGHHNHHHHGNSGSTSTITSAQARASGVVSATLAAASKDLLYSRPCHDCEIFLGKCMKKWGLRNVFYTTDMDIPYSYGRGKQEAAAAAERAARERRLVELQTRKAAEAEAAEKARAGPRARDRRREIRLEKMEAAANARIVAAAAATEAAAEAAAARARAAHVAARDADAKAAAAEALSSGRTDSIFSGSAQYLHQRAKEILEQEQTSQSRTGASVFSTNNTHTNSGADTGSSNYVSGDETSKERSSKAATTNGLLLFDANGKRLTARERRRLEREKRRQAKMPASEGVVVGTILATEIAATESIIFTESAQHVSEKQLTIVTDVAASTSLSDVMSVHKERQSSVESTRLLSKTDTLSIPLSPHQQHHASSQQSLGSTANDLPASCHDAAVISVSTHDDAPSPTNTTTSSTSASTSVSDDVEKEQEEEAQMQENIVIQSENLRISVSTGRKIAIKKDTAPYSSARHRRHRRLQSVANAKSPKSLASNASSSTASSQQRGGGNRRSSGSSTHSTSSSSSTASTTSNGGGSLIRSEDDDEEETSSAGCESVSDDGEEGGMYFSPHPGHLLSSVGSVGIGMGKPRSARSAEPGDGRRGRNSGINTLQTKRDRQSQQQHAFSYFVALQQRRSQQAMASFETIARTMMSSPSYLVRHSTSVYPYMHIPALRLERGDEGDSDKGKEEVVDQRTRYIGDVFGGEGCDRGEGDKGKGGLGSGKGEGDGEGEADALAMKTSIVPGSSPAFASHTTTTSSSSSSSSTFVLSSSASSSSSVVATQGTLFVENEWNRVDEEDYAFASSASASTPLPRRRASI